MRLTLQREPTRDGATLGRLLIDDVFACFTLEDVVRAAGAPKVPGDTAIPPGRYRVRLTHSPRFRRVLPELFDVPGFTAIRIHAGNTTKDTRGCPIVGRTQARAFVGQSRLAEQALVQRLQAATAAIWITVVEAPRAHRAHAYGGPDAPGEMSYPSSGDEPAS